MRLAEIQWHPTARQLRQFAACAIVVLPLVAWWSHAGQLWLAILIGVCLLLNLLAWIAPQLVRPVFIAAMIITFPIGIVVGELALIAIYLGVFLPIGLIFRMIGRDALHLKRGQKATYWEPRQSSDAKSYLRQY